MARILIKDDNGNNLTLKQATALIPGTTYFKVRHQVVNNKVKTLREVKAAVSKLKDGKIIYETTRGRLTLGEILSVHDDKRMTDVAMSNRIAKNGAMSEKLWGPLTSNGMNTVPAERIVCAICGRKLDSRQFKTEGVDTVYDTCKKCRGQTSNMGRKKSKSTRAGDIVFSGGKRYCISEFFGMKGKKGKVAAFRVMPGGQVLKNTTIDLGSDWSRVSP